MIWSQQLFSPARLPLPSPPPSIFLMLFQLQTFRKRGILSQHTHCERTYIYSFFSSASYLLTPFQLEVSALPRSLSNSNLLYWHDREETCVAEAKYISHRPIFSYFCLPASASLHLCISPSLAQPESAFHLSFLSIFLRLSCCLLPCFVLLSFFSCLPLPPLSLSLILFYILGI